ncbi:hypothetical protein ACFL5O_07035, partial [Myxococcota bacterium]
EGIMDVDDETQLTPLNTLCPDIGATSCLVELDARMEAETQRIVSCMDPSGQWYEDVPDCLDRWAVCLGQP